MELKFKKFSATGSYIQEEKGYKQPVAGIILGLLCSCLTLFILYKYAQLIPNNQNRQQVLPIVIPFFTSLFAFICFYLSVPALIRTYKRLHLHKLHPDKPWYGDFLKGRKIADCMTQNSLVKTAFGLCASFSFLTILLFNFPEEMTFRFIFALFFGVALTILCTMGFIQSISRKIKYPKSLLIMRTFPAFCDDKLHATLVSSLSGVIHKLELSLNCYTEDYHIVNKKLKSVGTRIYEDRQVTKEPFIIDPAKPAIEIYFDIPADAKSTLLYCQKPYFWELEIEANTPGVDYYAAFLVPVYRKPTNKS